MEPLQPCESPSFIFSYLYFILFVNFMFFLYLRSPASRIHGNKNFVCSLFFMDFNSTNTTKSWLLIKIFLRYFILFLRCHFLLLPLNLLLPLIYSKYEFKIEDKHVIVYTLRIQVSCSNAAYWHILVTFFFSFHFLFSLADSCY